MVIGDTSQFAIEYKLCEQYGGHWLFGKFCYWINGFQIGDYESGTALGDLIPRMKYLVYDNGNRMHDELFSLKTQELYNRLNRLYHEPEDSEYYQKATEETWARFDIAPPVDIFDNWQVFLVENFEESRILVCNRVRSELQEFRISKGQFDSVVIQAVSMLSRILDTELTKMDIRKWT